MNQNVKVQVPMTRELKTITEEKATEYGFSSLQELIRFMLTQFKNDSLRPTLTTMTPDVVINRKTEKRLRTISEKLDEQIKKGKAKPMTTVEEIMSQLHKS